jgi:hypothetical protein
MSAQPMTLEQIRVIGLEALHRALGPVGLVRFLQQFETGAGDYSVDRDEWLGQANVRSLATQLELRRAPRARSGLPPDSQAE